MAHTAWGIVMMFIGGLFIFWGSTESRFPVYRLFVARSRLLMGEQVHRFFQFSGTAIVLVGALMALGVI